MRKVSGVLAFAALLLVAAVTEAPAVAFNSIAGFGTCSSAVVTCVAGAPVAITPNPLWTPNGATAVWVSYAQTGQLGIVAPNALSLATAAATATYTFSIAAGFESLSLLLWADDTLGVRLDGASILAPSAAQGPTCAAVGVTCTGAGTPLNIPLGGLAHTLQFDVFQIALDTHGVMFQGDLQQVPIPEPASLLLVGSALAAVGFVSRRRMQKKQTQA